ncbi:DUF2812 domain-containing protein [Viridibacillus arvi]|uniref:DUF2812 domain-containing protein n=1 Tax=Viridibacillus arvi TaxID=263475 RepID=UPI0036E86E97
MVRKYRWFIDFEREERWLNDNLQKGYTLIAKNMFGVYHFVEMQNSMKIIRLDFQRIKSAHDFESYKSQFEKVGWKHIDGKKGNSFHYWIKVKDGNEKISSDKESFNNIFVKLSSYYATLMLILFFSIMFVNQTIDPNPFILNPLKAINYTNLLSMNGFEFVFFSAWSIGIMIFRVVPIWLLFFIAFKWLIHFLKYKKIEKTLILDKEK